MISPFLRSYSIPQGRGRISVVHVQQAKRVLLFLIEVPSNRRERVADYLALAEPGDEARRYVVAQLNPNRHLGDDDALRTQLEQDVFQAHMAQVYGRAGLACVED